MFISDPISDMLARIRNAQMRGKSQVSMPTTKLLAWVLDVMKTEGYIRGYEAQEDANGHKNLVVELKYFDGEPVIREMKRVSKPGRRVYSNSKDLPTVRQGMGVAIVSTSKGVMTDAQARSHNVGGEILCTLF